MTYTPLLSHNHHLPSPLSHHPNLPLSSLPPKLDTPHLYPTITTFPHTLSHHHYLPTPFPFISLCPALLCFFVLSPVVLCYVFLDFVMLCHAVPCFVLCMFCRVCWRVCAGAYVLSRRAGVYVLLHLRLVSVSGQVDNVGSTRHWHYCNGNGRDNCF